MTAPLSIAAWEAAAARVARLTVPAAADRLDPRELCCVAARLAAQETHGPDVVDRAPLALWHLWPEAGDPWGPVSAAVRVGAAEPPWTGAGYPPAGVWRVQLWRDRLWGSGHTATWTTDGSGDGWWWDSVDGRAFDARLRSWAEVTREARAGLRAVRLTAP